MSDTVSDIVEFERCVQEFLSAKQQAVISWTIGGGRSP